MFRHAVLEHRIKLHAREVGSNLREILESRCAAMLEGACCQDGYVRPGTTELLSVDAGTLTSIDMGRRYEFCLRIRAEVCNPLPGARLLALVRSMNKFGILAEAGYLDNDGTLIPVLEIILVRDSMVVHEIDFDKLSPGDEITVEIVGKRYELRDRQISAIGRALAGRPVALGEGADDAGIEPRHAAPDPVDDEDNMSEGQESVAADLTESDEEDALSGDPDGGDDI